MNRMHSLSLGSVWLATVLASACCPTQTAFAQGSVKEKELIGVLQSGQPADKALACKQLAIHGGKASCPELAKLLSDERLASWARIALQAIPDPAADEALRNALGSLQGNLAIGVINTIGVRRDEAAVDQLVARLQDENSEVASASAVSLGRIGNEPATRALLQSLSSAPDEVRSAVAEGCILVAESRLAAEKRAEAIAIYDKVRAAAVPEQRQLEAIRGAILARGSDGIPLLVEQLRSPRRARFHIGLTSARELPGPEVAEAVANELAHAAPDRAPLLVWALADRNDPELPTAVLEVAQTGDKQTRIAAIELLGQSGNATHLTTLLEIAAQEDAELAHAAMEALAALPSSKVNAEIIERMSNTRGKPLLVLIKLVGQRRINTTAALLEALEQPDPSIRAAALVALGETIGPDDLSALISHAIAPQSPSEADVAMQALRSAAVRMPDREACASQLAEAMEQASLPTRVSLLKILGAMGGPKALETIAVQMKGGDDQLQDAGSRLLGAWMTADAAPVLLEQANSDSNEKYQIRALRGYIRIARQFQLPIAERAEMCRNALAAATRPEERALVLQVLERYPDEKTLGVAIEAAKMPELAEDARATALKIASQMNDKSAARALLAKIGLKPMEIEIIKAEYGSGTTQRDVTEVLRKFARDVPAIELPSSYNQLFGDPTPGTVKQLKVQYRLNGKEGTAVFTENDKIVLAMPK